MAFPSGDFPEQSLLLPFGEDAPLVCRQQDRQSVLADFFWIPVGPAPGGEPKDSATDEGQAAAPGDWFALLGGGAEEGGAGREPSGGSEPGPEDDAPELGPGDGSVRGPEPEREPELERRPELEHETAHESGPEAGPNVAPRGPQTLLPNQSTLAEWYDNFELLRKHLEKHDNRMPLRDETPHLATWCARQKSLFSKKRLLPAAAEELQRLPGWTWARKNKSWTASFGLLRKYLRDNNNKLPTRGTKIEGQQLGAWCSHQRYLFAQGKLSAERSRKLESLGSAWAWDGIGAKWRAKFKEMWSFVEERRQLPTGAAGRWLRKQVRCLEKNKLNARCREDLERLFQLPGARGQTGSR